MTDTMHWHVVRPLDAGARSGTPCRKRSPDSTYLLEVGVGQHLLGKRLLPLLAREAACPGSGGLSSGA